MASLFISEPTVTHCLVIGSGIAGLAVRAPGRRAGRRAHRHQEGKPRVQHQLRPGRDRRRGVPAGRIRTPRARHPERRGRALRRGRGAAHGRAGAAADRAAALVRGGLQPGRGGRSQRLRPRPRGRPLAQAGAALPRPDRSRDRDRACWTPATPTRRSPSKRTTWASSCSTAGSSGSRARPPPGWWGRWSWTGTPWSAGSTWPTRWCWRPAAAARSTCTPAIRTSPRATAWPWPGGPGPSCATWSSCSSIRPACTTPRPRAS